MAKVDIRISSRQPAPPPPPPPSMPEPIRTITVPDDGARYMLLADDWDTERWGSMPRSRSLGYKTDPPWNALPATIPTLKLFYTLNREWQLFYFEMMKRATFGTMSDAALLAAYKSTTRDAGGWRDRHTWNNVIDDRQKIPLDEQKIYTDYVLGYNIPPAHTWGDAAQQDLLSSGNIVKVVSEATLGGTAAWVIETLNPFLPPPPVDEVWGKWWLVGWATLSAYNWDTGQKARLKWPFFNGYGCPLMFLGRDGRNRVPKYWCKPVQPGQTINLYTV